MTQKQISRVELASYLLSPALFGMLVLMVAEAMLAAATTWLVINAARKVAVGEFLLTDLILILAAQSASYVAGVISWMFAERAGYRGFGKFMLRFARENRGKVKLFGDKPAREQVEPFLTGAAVTGVLAQRLARKLCSHCCEMYNPSVDELLAARVSPDVAAASDGMAFYRKRGCPRCNQTGYKGRIGVFQLLTMTEDMATLAAAKASREEIERAALSTGMRTLWDDGMAKVSAGLTSIEELARVAL